MCYRYAQLAMRRLGLTDIITTEQLCQAQKRLQRWRRVVAFYTLRLSLAPIVETLLLLDKILYLQENGLFLYINLLNYDVISMQLCF